MSYDLYFTEPKIAFWQFEDYFSGRDNYNIENTQAWYANEDTGVYFSFEYTDEPSEDPVVSNIFRFFLAASQF